jgi:hypothetical protein
MRRCDGEFGTIYHLLERLGDDREAAPVARGEAEHRFADPGPVNAQFDPVPLPGRLAGGRHLGRRA